MGRNLMEPASPRHERLTGRHTHTQKKNTGTLIVHIRFLLYRQLFKLRYE